MRSGVLALVLSCFSLLPASATAATAPPDLTEAFDFVSRWVDTQNQHRFDDYAALYADDFEGVKRTSSGKETSYKLADWKADRKKSFDKVTLEISNEQYARLDAKTIGVVFRQVFHAGAYADHGLKFLKLTKGPGGLKIFHEEIRQVGKFDPNEDEKDLPDGFAADVSFRLETGNKRHECPGHAIVGPDNVYPEATDPRWVPLGVFRDDRVGEEGGMYRETLTVTPMLLGPLKGSAFVIVENFWVDAKKGNTWNNSTVSRRVTLIGKGPQYPIVWTGDLLVWPKTDVVKYNAKGYGPVTQRIVPADKEDQKPTLCRFATFSDEKAQSLGALYVCGASRTVLTFKDGRYQ
jgi:hypothetical protein